MSKTVCVVCRGGLRVEGSLVLGLEGEAVKQTDERWKFFTLGMRVGGIVDVEVERKREGLFVGKF